MRILALDLSTNTGWAFGAIGGPPVHGVIRLPSTKKDIGKFAAAFESEFIGLLGSYHPDRVVYESPILTSATSLIAARKLYGLAYHVELICDPKHRNIPCSETHMQTARSTLGVKPYPRMPKTVTGMDGKPRPPTQAEKARHRAEARKWTKLRVMRLCRAMGWEPENDDEADALAIWNDACRQFGDLRLAFS